MRKYIVDVNTRNMSFIQTSVDLKKLGHSNYTFFLRLYDTSLRNIDPYDPNLSGEEIYKVINECMINPWYYLREISRIPDQGNPSGIPYQLNRANLASTWCFLNGIDHYETIPRQIGKTQSTIAILTWAFLFGTTSSEFMFINMTAEKSVENLTRLKDQRDLLPRYLQFKLNFDENGNIEKGTNNIKSLVNATNGNRIITKAKATSIESAEKIGRGSTQPIQYYDEFEFINYVKTIMEASGPAFNTAARNAERNMGMYGRIFTSTPGDLDSQSGKDAMMVLENTCRWSESFYAKPIEEVKEYVDTNSTNGIIYIEYQYQQLGKDESWFRSVCKVLNNNPMKIKREIFLMRMRGSSMSPYDEADLSEIEERKGKIIEEIFILKIFKLDVYKALDRNKVYMIGVDVANGYGSDNSAVTVLDPYTLLPVAEFKSPNIGVKDLINFIYLLVKKYLPRAIVVVERNANGESVLEHLRASSILMNLYFDNTKDVEVDDKLTAEGMIKHEARRRQLYGIYTTGKTRERMFDLLEGHIKDHKDKFICANLIDDIMKLVRTKTGKIAAGPGFHDDCVMSYLMCLYVYYFGNNLQRYGFVRGSLPGEAERNKGLQYIKPSDLLSETDLEFFEGYTNEVSIEEELNIVDMINRNKGLISETELRGSMGNGDMNGGEYKPPVRDAYELQLYKEMMQAQQESAMFNRNLNYINKTENLDTEDGMYYASLDLFDELNS